MVGLFRRFRMILLVCLFTVCGAFSAFAADDPALHAFSVALALNGVNASGNIGEWYKAYYFNAKHRNDTVALSLVNELNGLSWGGTFSNGDLLYNSVKDWVDASGVDGSKFLYSTPITPEGLNLWPVYSSEGSMYHVSVDRISGFPAWGPETNGQVDFIFSRTLNNNSSVGDVYHQNVYHIRSGRQLFGIAYETGVSYWTRKLYFYEVTSSGGYEQVYLTYCSNRYKSDTQELVETYYPSTPVTDIYGLPFYDVDDLCVFPFPVFLSESDALEFCKTGSTEKAVKPNSYPLVLTGFYPNVREKELASIGDFSVPASADESDQQLTSLYMVSADGDYASVKSVFASAGVSIVYKDIPYTVNYYYDGVLMDSQDLFIAPDNSIVSAVPDGGKDGYRLSGSPYSPALPTTIDAVNNVIDVNYESWIYPYTVEYYYDGVLKDSQNFEVASYDNVISEVPVLEDHYYKLSDDPYDPSLPLSINDTDNVIKVHYVSRSADSIAKGIHDTFSGMKDFMLAMFPVSIPVVGVGSVGMLSLKIYRRLMGKA